MPEFLPTLIAGMLILVIAYAAFSLSNINLATGALIAKESEKQHIMLAEKTWISHTSYELASGSAIVTRQEGWLLPFKARPEEWEEGLLGFTVKEHSDAELVFILNGDEIYRGKASAGRHWVKFPLDMLDTENVLEAKVENWQFWMDSTYSFDAQVYGAMYSSLNKTFLAPKSWKRAFLLIDFDSNKGKLTIMLDGKEIYKDQPEGLLKLELDIERGKRHNIEIIPEPNTKNYIDYASIEFER